MMHRGDEYEPAAAMISSAMRLLDMAQRLEQVARDPAAMTHQCERHLAVVQRAVREMTGAYYYESFIVPLVKKYLEMDT